MFTIQNISATEKQKQNHPIQLRNWKRISINCFQKRNINGQQIHEQIINITRHVRNINQNQNVILSHD